MAKTLRKVLECGSIVPGCRFVAHAEDENEMMVVMADHARAVHDIQRLSEELKAKIRAAMKDA
jgi:predicted small metal-binding protein